jgi:hypothetical protein
VAQERTDKCKTSEIYNCKLLQALEIGKNKEGYWTGTDQVRTSSVSSIDPMQIGSHVCAVRPCAAHVCRSSRRVSSTRFSP